jgi:uncharacterized membrane protein (DUF373 family)
MSRDQEILESAKHISEQLTTIQACLNTLVIVRALGLCGLLFLLGLFAGDTGLIAAFVLTSILLIFIAVRLFAGIHPTHVATNRDMARALDEIAKQEL